MNETNGPDSDLPQMEEGIDRLLRRSMAAPIPSLPADFDRRLMQEVRRRKQPLDRYRRMLLGAYGVVSIVVSAILMRGERLDWGVVAGTLLATIALIAITRPAWRAGHALNKGQ